MAHELAAKKAPKEILENIPNLISAYYSKTIDINNKNQEVSFGTSGHRGNALKKSFNEEHILAITQAVCEYRKNNNINGALFIGKDPHALSTPEQIKPYKFV